jgi:hypothetical protein
MTARTISRSLAMLAGAAVLVAACGTGTPTGAPATNAPLVTQAPVTQAPATQAPVGSGVPGFSFDTSSFHADVELEDLFPDELGGVAIDPLSMTGVEFLSGGSAPEFDAMLAALNKTTADLSVAFGGAGNVTIIAFQVEGVPGSSILSALTNAFLAESNATITDMSFGGKSVKKIVPADSDDETTYVYATRDVIFGVGGEGITDAQLNEAFSKLP